MKQKFARHWQITCSCCQNHSAHEEAAKVLAEFQDVPMYEDGFGYNFEQFKSDNI